VDEHNHALAALRYLVSGIDAWCAVLGTVGRREGRVLNKNPELFEDSHKQLQIAD
jgi:hypothetical protein